MHTSTSLKQCTGVRLRSSSVSWDRPARKARLACLGSLRTVPCISCLEGALSRCRTYRCYVRG